MSLTTQLKELADQMATKIPVEAQAVMENAINDLKNSNLIDKALKTGDVLPNIVLPNVKGEAISLQSKLKSGKKLVIAFYRGGWCPYCNVELVALQKILPEIQAKGAELIAITPESPDNSLSTTEKNELTFEVLTDKDNKIANSLNLAYQLPEELNVLYKNFGIDLKESQGNTEKTLPIAATYVVEASGKVTYHFLKEDYKLRADTSDILNAI